MTGYTPAYAALAASGELARRAQRARKALASCDLCGWHCGVNRLKNEMGECRSGREAVVSGAHPHFGEEGPLVGMGGSGTIFFSWCNLHCEFCQNPEVRNGDSGRELAVSQLAESMLELQAMGCENINLVTPTHAAAAVLAAIDEAAAGGLSIPIVYNTGGYDTVETLKWFDGVVDIYMPDMKYDDDDVARKYSRAPGYTGVNRAAVREMHRQVGPLQLNEQGVALRGLLVRHLVLPRGLAGTAGVVRFLAEEISPDTYLNLMDQYHPSYRANRHPELARAVSRHEFREAVEAATAAGLTRLHARPGVLLRRN